MNRHSDNGNASDPSTPHPEDTGRTSAAKSIARIVEPRTQYLRPIEEKQLIHHDGTAHRHVDMFRELRTRLLALGKGNFITMIAPISRNSGGSFVACNLAAAFAFHEEKSAVLIDCDLRSPSQHANLRVDPESGGLIEYLDHHVIGLEKIIYPTGIPDLGLVPAGHLRHIGAEYFSSTRMRSMVEFLQQERSDRHIFIDAPPVIGSPDARILADLVDFVVLVAGSGKHTPESILKATSNFDSSKVAGIVFNELP